MKDMIQDKSWEITDTFWDAVKHLIPQPERDENKEYKRKPGGGRKPMDSKMVLASIFYVLRTGIQWKALPKQYGSPSAVHKYFMLWSKAGVFEQMWMFGLESYDELKGIEWEWQCTVASNIKSPLGQDKTGTNPTDRG
jgi:transposase